MARDGAPLLCREVTRPRAPTPLPPPPTTPPPPPPPNPTPASPRFGARGDPCSAPPSKSSPIPARGRASRSRGGAAGARRGPPAGLRALANAGALRLAATHAAAACDNNLVLMEAELNAPREPHAAEGGAAGLDHALGFMMHRLRLLLDVYAETDAAEGGGSAAVCGTMCGRRVRGRDRRKPFVFDEASGQFDQSR